VIVQQAAAQSPAIVQQPAAQLLEPAPQLVSQIPWGHNMVLLDKCKSPGEALFYVKKTIQNNWSRAVLTHQIESALHLREGAPRLE
jgi:predicted nuclease of restriction endonuclease-like (RecB) superfamily